MKALLAILLACACGTEPIEPEQATATSEAINVDQPKAAEKYMLGFIDGVNDRSYGAVVSVRYAVDWIDFGVFVTDPATDCVRANGYAEAVANMVASETPRHMGHQQAVLVMSDLELYSEPVCP